jgi:hypothetical protein
MKCTQLLVLHTDFQVKIRMLRLYGRSYTFAHFCYAFLSKPLFTPSRDGDEEVSQWLQHCAVRLTGSGCDCASSNRAATALMQATRRESAGGEELQTLVVVHPPGT